MDNAQSAKEDVQKAAPEIRTTLLSGVAEGVAGLKSLLFFLGFATLSTLFVLKDGPVMRRFINRHLGVPEPVGDVVTSNVAKSLRSYFLGVSIIAGFNAVVIGLAALIVGVPLAGTIAVVTFVAAYVPFVGAWVAGAFAVLIALGTEGTDARAHHGRRLAARQQCAPAADPAVRDGRDAVAQPARGTLVTIGAGALFGMVGLTLAAPLTSAAVHISNELRGRSDGLAAGAGAGAVRLAGPDRASEPRGTGGTLAPYAPGAPLPRGSDRTWRRLRDAGLPPSGRDISPRKDDAPNATRRWNQWL